VGLSESEGEVSERERGGVRETSSARTRIWWSGKRCAFDGLLWYLRREREFFIVNLLVRIHFIIVMIRWTGLAPDCSGICASTD